MDGNVNDGREWSGRVGVSPQGYGPIMDDDQRDEFIEMIGRVELYEELQHVKASLVQRPAQEMIWFGFPYPRYLKAVRVVLTSLGFDPEWVEGDFRRALEDAYPPDGEGQPDITPEDLW